MTSKYIFRIFSTLTFFAVISLSFIGSNCNDILNALNSGDVIGTWQLTAQGGAQYDVCPQENINFQNNTAVLTCPNQSSITRAYTASGGVLTYTDTGIKYNYSVTTESGNTNLNLTGISPNNRILQYTKIVTDKVPAGEQQKNDKQNFSNSSELK